MPENMRMNTSNNCRADLISLPLAWCVAPLLGLGALFANPVGHCADASSSESPLLKPAFAASAEELLTFANACDYDLGSADVDFLLDEGLFRIDSAGKRTTISRQVYRCLTRDAFKQHGVVHASWSSWYEDCPRIEARVISPDRQIHVLDDDTIEEIRIPSNQAYVFTDAKLLRAPLPGLAVGCVVETRITTCERRPFSIAGSAGSFQFGMLEAPTRLARVVVEAPVSTSLRYHTLRCDALPLVKRDDNLQVVTLSFGPIPALYEELEQNLPSDMSPAPMFIFTTFRSWNDVAKDYAAIVERQLAESDLNEVVCDVLGPTGSQDSRRAAELLLDYMKERIRYTAVSFGSAAIVPDKPQETLQRRYGDCKDLATLYVGLLRTAGLEADVALLRTGSDLDAIRDLPHLSCFNHAIVYLRDDPTMWIDPTDTFTPLGELSVRNQGRFALVANQRTTDLVRIARQTTVENRFARSCEITFTDTGRAEAATLTTYGGGTAPLARASYASADQKRRRDWLRQQGLESLGTDKLIEFSCTQPEDLKSPFQIKALYAETSLATVDHPNAYVVLPLYDALDWLPFDLTGPPDRSRVASTEDETKPRKQRAHPLELPFPFRHELQYRVIPAPGYAPAEWPEDQTLDLGPAKLEVTYRAEEDDSMRVSVVFDSGPGRFSAEEVRESRQKIEALGEEQGYQDWTALLHFEQTAAMLLESGRLREAVAAYHQLLRQYPDDPARHTQFAHALLTLGLGDLARTHARRAVELAPEGRSAQHTLGYVLAHNRIGEYLQPGFDRAGAVAAYDKALQLEPERVEALWEYGMLLEHDADGVLFGNREFTNSAIAAFAAAYEQEEIEDLLDQLVTAMYSAGRVEEALKLLENENASPTRDLLLLAGIAATEGVDACLERAAAIRPARTQRQLLLQQVMGTLSYFREYPAAADVARRLADNSPHRTVLLRQAAGLDTLSRYQPDEKAEEDPIGLVRLVMANALVHGTFSSRLKRFVANVPEETDMAFDCGLPSWLERLRVIARDNVFPPRRVTDIVTEFEYEEVEGGMDFHRILVKHKLRARAIMERRRPAL